MKAVLVFIGHSGQMAFYVDGNQLWVRNIIEHTHIEFISAALDHATKHSMEFDLVVHSYDYLGGALTAAQWDEVAQELMAKDVFKSTPRPHTLVYRCYENGEVSPAQQKTIEGSESWHHAVVELIQSCEKEGTPVSWVECEHAEAALWCCELLNPIKTGLTPEPGSVRLLMIGSVEYSVGFQDGRVKSSYRTTDESLSYRTTRSTTYPSLQLV